MLLLLPPPQITLKSAHTFQRSPSLMPRAKPPHRHRPIAMNGVPQQQATTSSNTHAIYSVSSSDLIPDSATAGIGLAGHPYSPALSRTPTGTHESPHRLVPPSHTRLSPLEPVLSAPLQSVRGRTKPDCEQYATHTSPTPLAPILSPFPPECRELGTSYFSNSSGFHIGHFNNVQPPTSSKTVFDYLDPYVSHGAAYNSDERCDAPKCSEETREAIQEERMTWLGGPAGAGKTAIAGSVAVKCAGLGILAGTFFFSSVLGSGDARRTKRCVISTLAYQLARHKALHEYRVQLVAAIEENPDIFRKCLLDQAQCLILDPLGAIHGKCDMSKWPRGIIYDGLDEVQAIQYHDGARQDLIRNDEDDQLEILEVILTLANSPAFPFRVFISTRPESNITEFLSTKAQSCTVTLFLDSKYSPDADIKRFLLSKFADIRRRSGISKPSWPGEEIIDQLVEMSSGQFIVPSIILRYIESGLPQRQLDEVMQLGQIKKASKNPFALLDALYTHIINRSPDPRLVVIWIRCITGEVPTKLSPREGPNLHKSLALTTSGRALERSSAHFWRAFLEETDGEFNHLLTPLAALLSIPPRNDRRSAITIHHKSLTDFLISKVRCGDLHIQRKILHTFVAGRYVCILQNHGPKVPFASYDELGDFLSDFLSVQLFPYPQRGLPHPDWAFSLFLHHMREPYITGLAACDVAWWTSYLLGKASSLAMTFSFPSATIAGIYCNVHAQCCSGYPNDTCHAACTHWREGILAEARALGWCVHELEGVPLRRLPKITSEGFKQKFKKTDDGQKCDVCQPAPDGQSEGQRQEVDGKVEALSIRPPA
ncbi:hypothetical protein NMY22_g16547 [Coprinellus aureogranulatus]|nr:hypothetical protein NMY22_g16547 [Coprinellus aureogranulatus]